MRSVRSGGLIAVLVVLVVAAILAAACAPDEPAPAARAAAVAAAPATAAASQATVTAGPPPDARATVQMFYEWYLTYAAGPEPRNPLVDHAYRQSRYLAPEWVSQVDETIAGFDKGGYDPFLCAQALPNNVMVDEPSVTGTTAHVIVRTSFEGHRFVVNLDQGSAGWLITEVVCQPALSTPSAQTAQATPPAGDAAGSQAYADQDYGFRLSYPAGWSLKTVPMEVTPDVPVKRALGFVVPGQPQSSFLASVEVYQAARQRFLEVFPGGDTAREITLNGRKVLFIEDTGSGQAAYVFEDPAHPDLRVVIRQAVDAGPVSAALAQGVTQVASSLEFGN